MKKLLLLILIGSMISIGTHAQGFIPKSLSPELKSKELDSIPRNLDKRDTIDFGKFYFSPPNNLKLEMTDTLEANIHLH
tara:strand:+ start:262 stop:498 length:237 start_codon:yes stop_codon:yes gene_type:complete